MQNLDTSDIILVIAVIIMIIFGFFYENYKNDGVGLFIALFIGGSLLVLSFIFSFFESREENKKYAVIGMERVENYKAGKLKLDLNLKCDALIKAKIDNNIAFEKEDYEKIGEYMENLRKEIMDSKRNNSSAFNAGTVAVGVVAGSMLKK